MGLRGSNIWYHDEWRGFEPSKAIICEGINWAVNALFWCVMLTMKTTCASVIVLLE